MLICVYLRHLRAIELPQNLKSVRSRKDACGKISNLHKKDVTYGK